MFEKYEVLSERELEARYEVFVEQYAVKLNIEAETAASIARTMMLPAAVRHLDAAEGRPASTTLAEETERLVDELVDGDPRRSRTANLADNQPRTRRLEAGRSTCATRSSRRWTRVREVADRLERIVADDLWPLPKYWEMLFIK